MAGRDIAGVERLAHLVRDEVNVKEVTFTRDLESLGRFVLKPVGAVVGPRLGRDTQSVMQAARAGDWQANADGTVTVAGHTLAEDEYELALHPAEGTNAAALRGNDAVVALDITITPELRAEGLARDLVRLIQQARKDQGLAVTDRIALRLALDPVISEDLGPWLGYVAGEVLAASLDIDPPPAAPTTAEPGAEPAAAAEPLGGTVGDHTATLGTSSLSFSLRVVD